MLALVLALMLALLVKTRLKSLVVVAEHEYSTNWGDCKPNKSNQMNKSKTEIKSREIKLNVGF